MLFGNGFRQPFSRMDARFNIYAYRLIFKLLRDPRLGGKLYNDEPQIAVGIVYAGFYQL